MKRSTMVAIGILVIAELLLFAANYTSNTWLIGWDNLNPEFDFKTNLLRNIFGVWQEYRGLGLYDGMSHVANTVHTIALWAMSLVLPAHLLRYVFIFGTHLIGGIGIYLLLSSLLAKTHQKTHATLTSATALSGSIFYLLNLTTIQIFHTPLESFSVHFAALPWIALTLRRFLDEPRQKHYIYFLLVCLLATPQFFVPTILLPTVILLCAVSLPYLFGKKTVLSVWKAGVGFILINAFWLLPYLWGIPQNASVIQAAKINQMSSSEAYARNQAFGSIPDVLLFRGFPLDFEDYTETGIQTFLMSTWRSWAMSPAYLFVGGFMIALAGLGIFQSIRKPTAQTTIFLIPLSFSFIILANNTPGIADIVTAVRTHIPFLGEALRFPYTKFGLLFAFSLTIFIHQGLAFLITYSEHHRMHIRFGIIGAFIFLIAFTAHPVFLGHFISPNMRVSMPADYADLYTFLRTKPTNDRMILLPQPTYWSWKLYQFGYRGSGFSWFGIPQPTLDRAFDPWSTTNENFYWELSHSLYSKNMETLSQIFDKYDVKYILIDEHVASTGNNRSLFIQESNDILSQMPNIKKTATFGKLALYENTSVDTKSFISVKDSLPPINSYTWTDNDIAFQEFGHYITGENATAYPFRSLFTKRAVNEREFTVKETNDVIEIGSVSVATSASILKLDTQVYDSTKTADLAASSVVQCGLLKQGKATASKGLESDQTYLRFESLNQRGCLSFGVPDLPHKDGYLVAVESRHVAGRPLLFSLINQTARHVELEAYLPTENQWQTSYFILPPLASDGLGYNVYLSNDSIGRYKTINDIRSIRIYKIPYEEMTHLHTFKGSTLQGIYSNSDFSVSHPNPAYYKVVISNPSSVVSNQETLILSQSYDPGWIAVTPVSQFPYLAPAGEHVMINNWANGWILKTQSRESADQTVILFFWPQLLQFLGFGLLPLPFLLARKLASTQ